MHIIIDEHCQTAAIIHSDSVYICRAADLLLNVILPQNFTEAMIE